jgi:AbrB family looped-hinge helix DNA binding protein
MKAAPLTEKLKESEFHCQTEPQAPCVMVIWGISSSCMVDMGEIATVTSKSMVTIPSKMRKKLGLQQGSKVEFLEVKEGLLLLPLKTLEELTGAGKQYRRLLLEGVRELNLEHREEAAGKKR